MISFRRAVLWIFCPPLPPIFFTLLDVGDSQRQDRENDVP